VVDGKTASKFAGIKGYPKGDAIIGFSKHRHSSLTFKYRN